MIPRMRTGVRVSDANQKQQPVKTIATTACKKTDRSARQHFVPQDLAITTKPPCILPLGVALNGFTK